VITTDRDAGIDAAANGSRPSPNLPAAAAVSRRPLSESESLEILALPTAAAGDAADGGIAPGPDGSIDMLRAWVSEGPGAAAAPAVVVPLYGCLVIWAPGRAALVGTAEQIGQLAAAVVEFAGHEAALRAAERRAAALLDAVTDEAAHGFSLDGEPVPRPVGPAEQYRESVALGRALALLAPVVHAPPVHPPTLANQLGERLRDRTRLAERHGLAVDRAELAERVAEARGQRALDVGIARRQTALEWAIVVLLVVQTVLLVVDLLARRATP